MEQATELEFVCLLFSVCTLCPRRKYHYSERAQCIGHSKQKKKKKAYMYTCPIPVISKIDVFHCTVGWFWHPILAFPLAVLHHRLKHANWCEASVDNYDCDVKMHSDEKHAFFFYHPSLFTICKVHSVNWLKEVYSYVPHNLQCIDVGSRILKNVLY
jgi:hypothetical protein